MHRTIITAIGVTILLALGTYFLPKPTSAPTVEVPVVATSTVVVDIPKEPTLVSYPEIVIQGEPVLIEVKDAATSSVKGITLEGKAVPIFEYDDHVAAIAPFDLYKKPGTYKAMATLADGKNISTDIILSARKKIEAPLGIPEKLGGNTKEAQDTLVATLADEAKVINTIPTGPVRLWTDGWEMPVANPYITDDYGYSRQTGGYEIAHKGTDFRAKEGTEVRAMNDGKVALVREFRNYGKMIAIDHGQGIQTLYLHLSKFGVKEGEKVTKGQVIGLSGSTGYAEAAHLHLTIKVAAISIDPMKFLGLFD